MKMHAPAPAFAARNAVASRPLHLLLGPSVLRVGPRRICSARAAQESDPFTAIDLMMDTQMGFMDTQMRQMNRDVDSMMAQARQVEQDAQRAASEALRYEKVNGDIRIQRGEEQGGNSYSYYQSISISSGPGYYSAGSHQQPLQATGISPLVFIAAMLAGAFATLAAAFAKGYNLTIYSPKYRPLLVLAWPFLFPFSSSFRTQFLSAIKGVRAPLPSKEQQQQKQEDQNEQNL